jgi:hypothetical protein
MFWDNLSVHSSRVKKPKVFGFKDQMSAWGWNQIGQ